MNFKKWTLRECVKKQNSKSKNHRVRKFKMKIIHLLTQNEKCQEQNRFKNENEI